MYEIRTVPGPLESYVLRDRAGDALVELVPARGGMVTRFSARGRELLYLDPATLADRSKNVRGGIPVLFPLAGRLTGDAFTARGASHPMKQHGFARNLSWDVYESSADADAARVTLGIGSGSAGCEAFPWAFRVRITYVLSGATLAVVQEYANEDATPMPLHAGFHPYFLVPDGEKSRTTVATDATRAYDNTTGHVVPFAGLDLTKHEVDLHLLDHRARTTRLERPGAPPVRIEMDASFKTLVVWTLAGKDFVCVEPWTAPRDALNTGDGLIHVPPGQAHRARFAITAE
jgi:galactose mutarotase-like enzyme